MINLIERIEAYHERQIKIGPVVSNRASMLADDCERRIVYWRTQHELAERHDVGLQMVFHEGNIQERDVLNQLTAAGVDVVEQQVSLTWKEYNITGHIDAVILHDGEAVPLEIKSMAPNTWNGLFRGAGVYDWANVGPRFQKKFWTRRIYGQIQLYLLLKEKPFGILLCKNKSNGAMAQVNIELDFAYAEYLVSRAESVNRHVVAGTFPDRVAYAADVCGECAFRTTCLPDKPGNPMKWLPAVAVADDMEIMEATRAARGDFERAKKRVNDWAKEQETDRIVVDGRFVAEVKTHGKGKRVDVKPLPAVGVENKTERE